MTTSATVENNIRKIIQQLDRDGVLARLPGNCILASDILQNLLDSENIPSRIMEVQAVITGRFPGDTTMMLLGYDTEKLDPGNTDTHVVVITQTDTPLLIDVSIGHLVGNPRAVVMTELSTRDPEIVAETAIDLYEIVYRIKKNIRMPYFHQRDLISKLRNEVKLQNDFKVVKMIAVIGLGVSVLNVLFNSILLGLKIIFP